MCVSVCEKVAASIGCPDASQVFFTSGGTEANNWVIQCLHSCRPSGKFTEPTHIVTTNIEHPSVALPIQTFCQGEGRTCTRVGPDPETGAVRVDDVVAALTAHTRLVSVMLANNETGVVQPVAAISRAVHEWADHNNMPRPAIHSDAAQALGKIPVNVVDLGIDFLTIAGHKFYGPRIGALYACRHSPVQLVPWLEGGGQELGLRSGTENTALIAGLGRACRLISDDGDQLAVKNMRATCFELRERLVARLGSAGVTFNCWPGKVDDNDRLPNTCSVALLCLPAGFSGRDVLTLCDSVVAGTGSACHSEQGVDRHGDAVALDNVLTRSGVSADAARRTLRLSTGRYTTLEEVALAAQDIHQAIQQLSQADT